MKRFRFALAPVLQYHQHQEQLALQELARRVAKLNVLRAESNDAQETLRLWRVAAAGSAPPPMAGANVSPQQHLRALLRNLAVQEQSLVEAVKTAQQEVQQRQQGKRKFEQLKEQALLVWRKEAARADEITLTEQILRRSFLGEH